VEAGKSRCHLPSGLNPQIVSVSNRNLLKKQMRRKENMAKKKEEGSGLQSSAGLMRYFEADDASIKLSPKIVIGACIGTGVVVMALNIAFGLWP